MRDGPQLDQEHGGVDLPLIYCWEVGVLEELNITSPGIGLERRDDALSAVFIPCKSRSACSRNDVRNQKR